MEIINEKKNELKQTFTDVICLFCNCNENGILLLIIHHMLGDLNSGFQELGPPALMSHQAEGPSHLS